MQLHAMIIKHGWEVGNTVYNALITAYSECGSIEDATRVFDSAPSTRDLITWNSMLAAYVKHDTGALAFSLFAEMQKLGFGPDIYTHTSILSACFEEACKNQGKSLHALVIKRGLEQSASVCNALIAMYLGSRCNCLEDALRVFESMEVRDRVSWNSILTGFSQFGLSEDALKFFLEMQHGNIEIDHYAICAVLRSCADLATLQLGQQIHVVALKSGFESNEFVGSSLIFMYSKCGIIEDARRSFESTLKENSITWNSIMFGYAQHGQGKVALDLFFLMRKGKVRLDHITFVAVLTACSHIGLVEEGCKILNSMESDYGVPLRMEHYACGIDLFGRAGRLDKAKALVEGMPFQPNAMVWKTLLGACRTCGDIELAAEVASRLLELEPEEHCTYVLLSDMYGHVGNWDKIAAMKRLMRNRGVKKVPGWSWIEVKNENGNYASSIGPVRHLDKAKALVKGMPIQPDAMYDEIATAKRLMRKRGVKRVPGWIEVKNVVHAFNAEDHSNYHCQKIDDILGALMEETVVWKMVVQSYSHVIADAGGCTSQYS
ncbi:hypothetical protein RJ639_013469 [Escallonia herrerae]|uniref:Chlororespiratory reduction 2 n=1 Tax=Escallonia herrerae TaxID=1293975 RepID=A0AA88VHS8_9ASTE|nr:hypothetical protein RJ639_013469 [Escallonia herrerae]